jgi:hypothetical protein
MHPLTKVVALVSFLTLGAPPARAPRFERVLPLASDEGVFAYARISPNGRYLVYASEGEGDRTVTLVDLQTKTPLFTEAGIDAYFSTDGERFIYLSSSRGGVSMYHMGTGAVTRDVAPVRLGDYFSWGWRDNRNLILTIQSNYYYLDGDKGVLPASRVQPCPDIGVGERPLLSRDGKRITTFVRGTIVVRNLSDCEFVLNTGIPGAKADFSWDGRYIAFHAPKVSGRGYDIQVVDIEKKTVRTVTNMSGSSYFPSWTKDGRLNFRYDGAEYRGFMMASDVLSAPARPLASTPATVPVSRSWTDIFPETPKPASAISLVTVWSTWSAHSPDALTDLQRARDYFAQQSADVSVATATEPGSLEPDIARLIRAHHIDLPRIPLAPERLNLTEAQNQIPTTLLFRDGTLVDRRLGAQTYDQLREWVEGMSPSQSHPR